MMSERELYGEYISWQGDKIIPLPMGKLLDFPFANADIFKDVSVLINRLFFFEKNVFYKDYGGDLYLVSFSFHMFDS